MTGSEDRSNVHSVGIIVGLEAEARVARRLGWPVETGGGTPEGARDAAELLIQSGVGALLSFGLAGGLDPALRAGDVVIPAWVLEGTWRWAADPGLAAQFGPMEGALYGGGTILATASAKRAVHLETGAVAVDLESAAVARVAAARGVPFAVLRAICDTAARDLPPAALAALDARGRIGAVRVAASLIRHPGQLPALVALARDAARARQALRRLTANS